MTNSAAYQAAYRRRRIADGLCVTCGDPNPGGKTKCADCRRIYRLKFYTPRPRKVKSVGMDRIPAEIVML